MLKMVKRKFKKAINNKKLNQKRKKAKRNKKNLLKNK